MKKHARHALHLHADTVRLLTSVDLAPVVGGHPSSFPQCIGAAARKTTSSDADGELCPNDWTYYCGP